MVGERNGIAALLDKYCKENGSGRDLIKIHCLVHQEDLCAKSVNYLNYKCGFIPPSL